MWLISMNPKKTLIHTVYYTCMPCIRRHQCVSRRMNGSQGNHSSRFQHNVPNAAPSIFPAFLVHAPNCWEALCADLRDLAAGGSAEIRPACELFPACFGAKSVCETPKEKGAWNVLKAPIPDHICKGLFDDIGRSWIHSSEMFWNFGILSWRYHRFLGTERARHR